ncbi:unnamed protein product [Cochlearia groenlandica]
MVRVGEALSVSTSSCSSLYESESEELQEKKPLVESPRNKSKKRFSRQLSMLEMQRDSAWERRRHQMLQYNLEKKKNNEGGRDNVLTDEDLNELKGSIELGFGFNEEQGQKLTTTLPALDFYFAVSRQISPVSPPSSGGSSSSSYFGPSGDRSFSFSSPRSDLSSDALRLMSPGKFFSSISLYDIVIMFLENIVVLAGDSPLQVKTRLRHWAQAVACSVMQSYNETDKQDIVLNQLDVHES